MDASNLVQELEVLRNKFQNNHRFTDRLFVDKVLSLLEKHKAAKRDVGPTKRLRLAVVATADGEMGYAECDRSDDQGVDDATACLLDSSYVRVSFVNVDIPLPTPAEELEIEGEVEEKS